MPRIHVYNICLCLIIVVLECLAAFIFSRLLHCRHRLLFDKPSARQWLREAVVKARNPFAIDAWVLLPSHLHCLWTLPEGDSDYSTRWNLIKSEFSKKGKGTAPQTGMDERIETQTQRKHFLAKAGLGACHPG